ncbi:GTP cyclohydrolase II [Arthrobacter glacialis]|uniref:GTP cyclohydrolase II n=1 Tax=Arthrobacter glacialis TaxID=1664 RepID=UPI000CD40B19|nr:GTP cyclohydrolase II [Arthrobacter glacialis]POH57471.1 GTP cyclohydrolase II [Arthrobacter glacialis]
MTESCVSGGPVVSLPTKFGVFQAQAWTDKVTGAEHLSVTSPHAAQGDPLVRLHSECLTGDVLGSYRCDCGEQLDYALGLIYTHGGTLVYLRGHEGRGIGLANKMRAYALQEAGADTVDANEQLGFPADARDYASAAGILVALGLDRIKLLSNNPLKSEELSRLGIAISEIVATEVPARSENVRYLETKRDRMRHVLNVEAPEKATSHATPNPQEGPSA